MNAIQAANGKFALFGNEFGIMVNIADYDTDIHIQTKKATYREIQALWSDMTLLLLLIVFAYKEKTDAAIRELS